MGRNGEGHPRKFVVDAADSLALAAAKAFASGLERLRAQEDGAVVGDVESLHQLRVATRRLRASIDLFRPILNGNQVRLWQRDLPWIAGAAGEVRERDVIEAVIKARAAKIDPKLLPSLETIHHRLAAERAECLSNLGAILQSERYQQMVRRLSVPALRKGAETLKLAQSAAQLLRPMARGAVRAGEHLVPGASAETVHRARVRVKRLRYALELVSGLGRKRQRKAMEYLEQMQDLLGEFNDAIVTCAWLIRYGASPDAPPATALAAGALVQSLGKRQRKLAARCLKAWRKFDRSAIMRDTLGEIRRSGQLSEPATPPASSNAA